MLVIRTIVLVLLIVAASYNMKWKASYRSPYCTPLAIRSPQYVFVHEAFRRNNYTMGKFVTHDSGYIPIDYKLKQNVLWNHRSVCSKDTFVILLYFIGTKDIARRNLIRQYLKQDMVADGKKINYMFVVVSEENDVETTERLMKENDLFDDLLVSIHKNNYANVTVTVLDAFLWVRDYCKEAKYVGRIDGDAWVHLGNLVHYLKSVPLTRFYGGHHMHTALHRRTNHSGRFYLPADYPIERRMDYNSGGANLYSRDVIPYINIGTQYMDIIFHAAEDVMIGEILRRVNITPFGPSKDYVVYMNYPPHKRIQIPFNAILVHNLKKLHLLNEVYTNFSSTYTKPCGGVEKVVP